MRLDANPGDMGSNPITFTRIWTSIWTFCPDSSFRYKNLDNNYSKKIGGLKLRLQVKVILPMAVY